MALQQLQPGIYTEESRKGKTFWTKNLLPGVSVYDEKLIENGMYREWSIKKSKIAAGLAKGLPQLPVKSGDAVLYLGASTGTTVSHISDIVGKHGIVFAVEFSFYMLRRLVFLAEKRKNIAPLLADAKKTKTYMPYLCEVDFLFQDIAQKQQVEIFLKNLIFLKKNHFGMLAVKAKSVDVTAEPQKVYAQVKKQLEKEVKIIWSSRLDPFEKDHCLFLVEKL